MDKRIFVEKKPIFNVEANDLKQELNENLKLLIEELRIINIYDVFNIEADLLKTVTEKVFSEAVTDNVFYDIQFKDAEYFAFEFLPGQFDQRASSAEDCIKLFDSKSNVTVKSGKIIIITGDVSQREFDKIKNYCINPVDSQEKNLEILQNKISNVVSNVPQIDGFMDYSDEQIKKLRKSYGFAMSDSDLMFVRDYFKNDENRDPNETELKMLDTYWSDHCRHTTFETSIDSIRFTKDKFGTELKKVYLDYLSTREQLNRAHKPVTLMDLATINAKYEKLNGNLNDLELSDEINACSIFIDVDVDEKLEKYLLMFKNETHNHPTEIEPYGGASTCLGGAIRDPLSGRSYVYQAMRITGAGNINARIKDTLPNKLPQRVISKKAAAGFSGYGNQIGLATTFVKEIYDDGFLAKRLETGVVVGAVKAENVKREKPIKGDKIILLGGATGRDGVGGATGSSKEHDTNSLSTCFAEVQKGNAPEERKIQRLFRNPEVTLLIKKSNDFGAGGVAVAIGELADGLIINLDKIPLKYNGLNATEIAISESQERMAVVVEASSVDKFIELCKTENINAVVVAEVTDNNRLIMTKNEKMVVNLSRAFIDTSGVRQHVKAATTSIYNNNPFKTKLIGVPIEDEILDILSKVNNASQRGLKEMFDSTIGATTVLLPYGGKYQLTEGFASVQKIPLIKGKTHTCSILTHGYNVDLATYSPYHSSCFSIIESMAKAVAAGGDYKKIRFSFQEYFERLYDKAESWGKPLESLLGAFNTLKSFGLAAIGGKDSMSGSFLDLNVPPTLLSFAVCVGDTRKIISNDLKELGSNIYLINCKNSNKLFLPNYEEIKQNFDFVVSLTAKGKILSAEPVSSGGIVKTLSNMSLGNKIGCNIITDENIFDFSYGNILIETKEKLNYKNAILIGTTSEKISFNGAEFTFNEIQHALEKTFKSVYPISVINDTPLTKEPILVKPTELKPKFNSTDVNVFIPVFPGSNCEYDTAKAFVEAGANVEIYVFKNLDDKAIEESINHMANSINNCQIVALGGGFSSGDEPDGSGKFIVSVICNKKIKEAINNLLAKNGLILGICNGFQALVKSGLLPFGEIGNVDKNSPTLFKNDINRHISKVVKTKLINNNSPWLKNIPNETVFDVAVSHGEGKFVANESMLQTLRDNGQIAFVYCDNDGNETMNGEFNPNGSSCAIESIVSNCGKIFGKMGHSERYGNEVFKNLNGFKDESIIFKNAVEYFKQK